MNLLKSVITIVEKTLPQCMRKLFVTKISFYSILKKKLCCLSLCRSIQSSFYAADYYNMAGAIQIYSGLSCLWENFSDI